MKFSPKGELQFGNKVTVYVRHNIKVVVIAGKIGTTGGPHSGQMKRVTGEDHRVEVDSTGSKC
jgi:hypothetical protein